MVFDLFIKNQVTDVRMSLFLNLQFELTHQVVCVCIRSVLCSFYYYCSVVQLEVRDGDMSRNSFIVPDCFSNSEIFLFLHMKMIIIFSRFVKMLEF